MTSPHSLIRRAIPAVLLLLSCSLMNADDPGRRCRHGIPDSIDPSELALHADDEIWVLSSRCIRTCGPVDLSRLDCYRWCGETWCKSKWQTVVTGHQSQTEKQTVFFLHGNRTNFEWSETRGLQVFNGVFGSDLNRRPIRFVIWSWPADPQSRRLKEYRQNSERSVWEANALAQFMHELGPATPIGLIGYSLGAQTVLIAAEKTCSRSIEEGLGRYQFRIACVAAAYQKPWSKVAEPFAGCAECLTHSLQMSNSHDRALRVHYFASHIMGQNYSASTNVDELSPRSVHRSFIDVGQLVGPRHSVVLYAVQPYIAAQIRAAVTEGIELAKESSAMDSAVAPDADPTP